MAPSFKERVEDFVNDVFYIAEELALLQEQAPGGVSDLWIIRARLYLEGAQDALRLAGDFAQMGEGEPSE